MQVLLQAHDLSDDYLRFAAQIGAGGFDISPGPATALVPGVEERGYADERGVRGLLDRLERWGLGLYRVTTPQPTSYLLGQPGGAREVDHLCRTLEALGRAGVRLASVPLDVIPVPREGPGSAARRGHRPLAHRGGYTAPAFDLADLQRHQETPLLDAEAVFERSIQLYERLAPIAEAHDVRLTLHPSGTPLRDAPLSPSRWLRMLEAVPSSHNGLLYCVGTRFVSGVNIAEDIEGLGRRGKIFHVHLRDVRGTIPTTGGYEEVALGDGEVDLPGVLRSLKRVGYDGGLQVDHLPRYHADTPFQGLAAAYAVGYIRALLAVLDSG
jgi:mannonate dehydratase